MTFESSMMQNVPSSIAVTGGFRGSGDPPQQHSIQNSNRPRRPRSRRDKDKRFTCDYEGCEKTYTRAEHLTRHQLNRKCPVILLTFRLSRSGLVDAGAFKFVCRVDPRCQKRFVRGDLLTRHEERHQNRKNKQVTSDDGHSPPRNIAPSPTGSPTSELANNFTRAITIPMSQSPDYDHGDYPGSEDGDRSGPLSSPDEMSLDGGYTYHSPTPNRQTFPQNYGNNPAYASPLSTSPNNYGNSGFVPINQQQFQPTQIPVLDQSQRGFPYSSEPVAIPQATAYSPPGNETNVFASFFTGQEGGFMDINNPLGQGNGNWLDLYVPTALSWDGSNGGTWNEQFDIQQNFSSQPTEVPFEPRRSSVYYPTVASILMLANGPAGYTRGCVTQ